MPRSVLGNWVKPCLCALQRHKRRSKAGKIEMLFYTSIFLASLLVAGLIYKAVILSSKAVSKASGQVSSSEGRFAISANASGYQNNGALSKAVTCASITPSANNHVTAWNMDNLRPVKNKVSHIKNNVWPPAAAIGASFDRATQVTRYDGGPKKVTLDMVSKPYRRNVAPDALTPETAGNHPIKGNMDSNIPARETIDKLIMQKGRPVRSRIDTGNKPWGW